MVAPIIKLQFDVDDKKLNEQILKDAAKQVNSVLFSVAKDTVFKTDIADLVNRGIRNSPEANALISGILRDMFGIPNPDQVITNIVNAIIDNMEINVIPVVPTSNTFNGSITVNLLKSDFTDVLTANGVLLHSTGGDVPWLQWMLTAGDAIVLAGYDIKFYPTVVPTSRTGKALTVAIPTGGFRVPPEFSGTASNNWLTRALEDIDVLITNLLRIEILRRL